MRRAQLRLLLYLPRCCFVCMRTLTTSKGVTDALSMYPVRKPATGAVAYVSCCPLGSDVDTSLRGAMRWARALSPPTARAHTREGASRACRQPHRMAPETAAGTPVTVEPIFRAPALPISAMLPAAACREARGNSAAHAVRGEAPAAVLTRSGHPRKWPGTPARLRVRDGAADRARDAARLHVGAAAASART